MLHHTNKDVGLEETLRDALGDNLDDESSPQIIEVDGDLAYATANRFGALAQDPAVDDVPVPQLEY